MAYMSAHYEHKFIKIKYFIAEPKWYNRGGVAICSPSVLKQRKQCSSLLGKLAPETQV